MQQHPMASLANGRKVSIRRNNSDVPLLGANINNVEEDAHSLSTESSLLHDEINDSTNFVLRELDQEEGKELKIQQGVVLLEDAIHYRSIHHKMDRFSLRLYRWYHSVPVQWSVYAVIFILMFLAFLEEPSSLTWSSDPRLKQTRFKFPSGLIEGIEFSCLLLLLVSTIVQSYLAADVQRKAEFPKKHPWLTGSFIIVIISIVDLIISASLGSAVYKWRFRRLFRPFFLAGSSTMLKKTLKCIRNTLPEIASVLTLLLLHVYFFMMLGMLIFPRGGHPNKNTTHSELNNTEWKAYFSSLDSAFISLLVLLTTANNPDVMMPAYSQNRLYALYFLVFSLIGTFLIFNLLTAVVYNQFRGYFQNSMQSSHFRRCVAFSASFAVLSETKEERNPESDSARESVTDSSEQYHRHRRRIVEMEKLRTVLAQVAMRPEQRTAVHHNILSLGAETVELSKMDFQLIFSNIDSLITSEILQPAAANDLSDGSCCKKVKLFVLHPAFNIVSNIMVLLNAIIITVEIAIHYEQSFRMVFSRLNIVNYAFAGYYTMEQTLRVIALGKKYFLTLNAVYDGMITLALLVVETVQLAKYGGNPSLGDIMEPNGLSLWDCGRIINILILLRLLRIIPNFKPMAVVTSALLEIMRNLSSFAGVLAIIYYVFAIIGMILFEGKTNPTFNSTMGPNTTDYPCGSFEQLQYWANNFNDFAASLVVLWDIMVVNNWGVFLEVYSRRVGLWTQAYFIIWWVISVVISVNLFIALILDHFIAKWDRAHESYTVQRVGRRGTVQALFRDNMHEPSPQEVNDELLKHPYLSWCVSNS